MQIDLDTKLWDHFKKEPEDPNLRTVGTALHFALIARASDDPSFEPKEAVTRFRLAVRLSNGGKIELDPDETGLLRARAAKLLGVWFAGQILEATDPKPARPAAIARG